MAEEIEQVQSGQEVTSAPGVIAEAPSGDKFSETRSALAGLSEANPYETSDTHQESFLPPEAPISEAAEAVEASNGQTQESQTQEQTEPAAQTTEGKTGPEGQQNSTEETAAATETPSGVSIESEMTGTVALTNEEAAAAEVQASTSFESFEAMDTALNGIDPDLNSANLVEKLPELYKAKESFDTVSAEKQNLEKVFGNLPETLYKAVLAAAKNEDWRTEIESAPKFDFSKEFKDQNQDSLTNHFFPGKISADEWADFNSYTPDDAIKEKVEAYRGLAEESFKLSKQTHDIRQSNVTKDVERMSEKINTSYESSRENLSGVFEGTKLPVTETFAKKVNEIAQDRNALMGLFYNPDGTFKEDAHQRIAMAMGGKQLVANQYKQLEKRHVTKARQEVIGKTADTLNTQTGGGDTITESQKSQQKARETVENTLFKTEDLTFG